MLDKALISEECITNSQKLRTCVKTPPISAKPRGPLCDRALYHASDSCCTVPPFLSRGANLNPRTAYFCYLEYREANVTSDIEPWWLHMLQNRQRIDSCVGTAGLKLECALQ